MLRFDAIYVLDHMVREPSEIISNSSDEIDERYGLTHAAPSPAVEIRTVISARPRSGIIGGIVHLPI